MTATAIMYTSGGFAVAADGWQRWRDKLTRDAAACDGESAKTQKIFGAEMGRTTLAYVVRGDVASKDRSFDIVRELQAQLRGKGLKNYLALFQTITANLQQTIERAKTLGAIHDYPTTHISFVGYRKTDPFWIDVRFHPYMGRLVPDMVSQQLYPGFGFVSGSLVIRDLISDCDPRVSGFVKPMTNDPSLEDATAFTRGYIEACASPLGLELDPENCEGLGGHTHVATVTPIHDSLWREYIRGGKRQHFRWVIPPITDS